MPFLEQLGSAKWTKIISEAVTDSFIVWVKMVSLSIRFQWINATRMNSLSYLPCFALLRMHLCGIRLAECTPSFSLSPSFPLCALNQHKFGFIVFICLFTLISFPFQRLPIRDLQTSEAEWQGSRQVYIWVRMSVCVFRDKIKIQMERKHWNHHFCYRQLRGLRLPLLTNSSRVMKQKALKCTHFMTHRISFK